MAHRIDVAKTGRSRCATCGAAIARRTIRVCEEYFDAASLKDQFRHHHIDCAITAIPYIARDAVGLPFEPGVELDRALLGVQIGASIATHQQARRERYEAEVAVPARAPAGDPGPTTDADGATSELLRQLEAEPDDAGVLGVLADLLLAANDPRGELISVQLALKTAGAARLIDRRDELMTRLTPPLDAGERCVWGTGYVRRVELVVKQRVRFAELAALWHHPSLRLVAELRLEVSTTYEQLAAALAPVRGKLRRLELVGSEPRFVAIADVVRDLPRLAHLTITERADHERLAHPRLASLELVSQNPSAAHELVPKLSPVALPALVELALHRTHEQTDPVCIALEAAGWLDRLTRLALIDGTLGERGISALAKGLGGRRLARLDVSGNPMPVTLRGPLAALCDELVFPNQLAPVGPVWVEHTGKPAWGRGTLVRRFDGKLEVEFPGIGKKVFRDDAPFLRLG